MSEKRENMKSTWIMLDVHSWFKKYAVDQHSTLEIEINKVLESFIFLEDQKKNEFIKQDRILSDSKSPG